MTADGRRLIDETARAGEGHLDAASVAAYDRKAAFDPGSELAPLQRLGLGGRLGRAPSSIPT